MNSITKQIKDATDTAQKLIDELYISDPVNATFEQVGFLNGREIVMDFISHNEWGCALEHLLYMVHESEIDFPGETLRELHEIAKNHGLASHHTKQDQLTQPGC